MELNLESFKKNEERLFFRFEGEPAERHGAIGYLRADFGKNGKEFWTKWFDIQPHLKTQIFTQRTNMIVNLLRCEMPYSVFNNRKSLEAYCILREGQRISDRGIGFKLQAWDYTYYARCRPSPCDYDIYMFAYDNKYLLPELERQNKQPEEL